MKITLGLFLTVCFLSLAYNCKSPQINAQTFTPQDSLIHVTEGTLFSIQLPSNIGTGYSWSLAVPIDTSLLSFVDQAYIENDLMTREEESREIWRFRAKGKGQTSIEMIYKRPWEVISQEAKEQVFYIKIE